MRRDYKILPVAAAGAVGFAAGISWASKRIRNTSFGKLGLSDHNVVPQTSGGARQNQLPPPLANSPTRMTETIEPFSPDVLKRRIVEVFP